MTEENLKRCNQIQKLLNEDIEFLSDIRLKNHSEIGKALSSIMNQDEKFKDLFKMILKDTKERLTTEFELM